MRFRAAAGRSILEEIRRVRLEAAKRLLVEGRTTIDAIEERTGFNFFANVPSSLQDAAEKQTTALW